jgi:hypothetical protein
MSWNKLFVSSFWYVMACFKNLTVLIAMHNSSSLMACFYALNRAPPIVASIVVLE